MDSYGDNRRDPEHVIIDLPQRLRSDEIERLNAAAARAPFGKPKIPSPYTSQEVDRARDRALDLVNMRRERDRIFDALLFSDPSWDLLLTLFVRRVDGHPTSVSSACNGIGSPPSTAFRHLSMLVEQGWVTRRASENESGVVYVDLTDEALDNMTGLLKSAHDHP